MIDWFIYYNDSEMLCNSMILYIDLHLGIQPRGSPQMRAMTISFDYTVRNRASSSANAWRIRKLEIGYCKKTWLNALKVKTGAHAGPLHQGPWKASYAPVCSTLLCCSVILCFVLLLCLFFWFNKNVKCEIHHNWCDEHGSELL